MKDPTDDRTADAIDLFSDTVIRLAQAAADHKPPFHHHAPKRPPKRNRRLTTARRSLRRAADRELIARAMLAALHDTIDAQPRDPLRFIAALFATDSTLALLMQACDDLARPAVCPDGDACPDADAHKRK